MVCSCYTSGITNERGKYLVNSSEHFNKWTQSYFEFIYGNVQNICDRFYAGSISFMGH